MIAEGHDELKQQQREDAITSAYLTAMWSRQAKKLPSLKKILEGTKPKKQAAAQTPEQMFAIAMRLNAANGGDISGEGEGK